MISSLIEVREARGAIACAMAMAALSACGGGGGGGVATTPSDGTGTLSVTSAVAATPKFGQNLALTVSGTDLDQGLVVAATGCTGVTLDASVSSATSAVYRCTVSAVGQGQFTLTKSGNNVALVSPVSFTVPEPQVTLNYSNAATVSGALVLTLSADKAPVTVANFLGYVNSGFYANTVFHRVSPGFVIQGGGYTAPLDAADQNLKTTSSPIALESTTSTGLSNVQWTIAMARSSAPASATSQFFINLADNTSLDAANSLDGNGYAVFGSVTSDTTAGVTAIAGAPCAVIPQFLPTGDCTPTPNVVITSATQTR